MEEELTVAKISISDKRVTDIAAISTLPTRTETGKPITLTNPVTDIVYEFNEPTTIDVVEATANKQVTVSFQIVLSDDQDSLRIANVSA
tara:strand:+ start:266 stop:532 length:267 start_codon:yes stop_codon:yes gene_type:complete